MTTAEVGDDRKERGVGGRGRKEGRKIKAGKAGGGHHRSSISERKVTPEGTCEANPLTGLSSPLKIGFITEHQMLGRALASKGGGVGGSKEEATAGASPGPHSAQHFLRSTLGSLGMNGICVLKARLTGK